ncbi:MAG: hypothetical protein GF353_00265 [Candidatus Lokiarchaeota archaeon]|nr:hypothetical protein [Candidatus Lokiarchaeota archaeon]
MYRSYLLKNNFYAKKGNETRRNPDEPKVFIKHDENIGGIYAIVENDNKGVKIHANGEEHFFNNFDRLEVFLNRLKRTQDDFVKILKRKNLSKRLRTLDI